MPKLVINPDTVVISLSGLEKVEAFHEDLTLPRSAHRTRMPARRSQRLPIIGK